MIIYTAADFKRHLEEQGQSVVLSDRDGHWKEVKNQEVTGLTYDSRQVKPQTLFVCKGAAFKEKYLNESVASGAIMYVSETAYDVPIPGLIVPDVRVAMPLLADLFFNSPQKKLTLIGVTGTKGKTSTVYFLQSILNHYFANRGEKPVGMISTVEINDGKEIIPSELTTPESIVLFSHLANAVAAGLTHIVVECSSQALKYNRLDGLNFDIGIFLNIDNDHISPIEHHSFEDYLTAKLHLFDISKTAIYSLDSRATDAVQKAANKCSSQITFSTSKASADITGSVINNDSSGLTFTATTPGGASHTFKSPISGRHNLENALATIACCRTLGISDADIQTGFAAVKTPGRMDIRQTADHHIACIIDFAHNRMSFNAVIDNARELFPGRPLIAVFGTVGDRSLDRGSEMAESVIEKGIDYVVVTDDDPGPLPPAEVRWRILKHLRAASIKYTEIGDRTQAMQEAMEWADRSSTPSVILLLGRGPVNGMQLADGKTDYPSDIEIVEKLFHQRDNKH